MTITSQLSTAIVDRYRIESHLGEGGMATVYLAHDLKHDRKVALKVLRPELAAVIGAERFLQEIKVTANLQHPHILPLHDSGEAGTFLYYVMPYIEGDTLRDKLDREKQLSIEEAIEISRSIASGLDYAHRQGVIHRDIKPENILMHDGQAMIADFGIALAVSEASGKRLTETGLSIGTPHYMSPEQAMGDRELDARSDVYSVGAMLYEMLAGEPPYQGTSAQAIVAKVITEKAPPVTAARDTVPGHVNAAIVKALAKMPADRFATAAAFADALTNTAFVGTAQLAATEALATATPTTRSAWQRFAWPAATVVFAALAVGSFLRPSAETTPGTPTRFFVAADMNIGSGGRLLAVSPDGSEIVIVGTLDGQQQLLLRRASELDFTPIGDTDGGRDPAFSPDGEWLGFRQGADIKRVRTSGGAALTVVRDAAGGGMHWGQSDEIILAPGPRSISIVPGSGGTARSVEVTDSLPPGGFRWPHLLPDGRRALVTLFVSLEEARIILVDLETGAATVLVEEGVFPQYVQTGHIVYGHASGTIFAVPFDAAAGTVTGQPTALLEDVQVFSGGATQFAPSEAGTVAYLRGDVQQMLPVLVDGSGRGTPIELGRGQYSGPRFSPDGDRLLLSTTQADVEVGSFDLRSNTLTTVSTEAGTTRYPLWSRDGEWVIYGLQSEATQGADIARRRADGSGDVEILYSAPGDQWPQASTRDGSILIRDNTDANGRDLLLLAAGADSLTPVLTGEWHEWAPKISPDERWLAYVSDESGRTEVYVTAFPNPGGKVQISRNGANWPVWSPDGQRLYYRDDRNLMAANLRIDDRVTVADHEVLFDDLAYNRFFLHADYDVHPDGEPFVYLSTSQLSNVGVTVVLNWFSELRELMGEDDS